MRGMRVYQQIQKRSDALHLKVAHSLHLEEVILRVDIQEKIIKIKVSHLHLKLLPLHLLSQELWE